MSRAALGSSEGAAGKPRMSHFRHRTFTESPRTAKTRFLPTALDIGISSHMFFTVGYA
jgi:hypothetical protein